jgi:hypothetical protein
VITANFPLALFVYHLEQSVLKACLYSYSSLYFSLSMITALSMLSSVQWRLETMRTVLEDLKTRPYTGDDEDDENDLRVITALIDIYADLIEVCSSVNLFYSLPCMLGYGLVFFHTLIMNFLIFQDFSKQGALTKTTLVGIIYAVYYNSIFIGLIFTAHLNKQTVMTFKLCFY